MIERWIPAANFPKYEVSENGDIRNAETGRVLKTQTNKRGYKTLTLWRDKIPHTVRVNRIIAESFYGGDHEGLEVNHIDGNKSNNNIGNLEFCTRKENVQHAIRTGLRTNNDFGNKRVRVRVNETGEVYGSINECSRSTGIDRSEIGKYLSGKIDYPPKGLTFSKAD